MSCHDLEEAIVEVGRGRDVGRGTAAAVDAHVEHCAACARRLARERQVSSGLRALAAATSGEIPSALLERQLRAAFAAHHQVPSSRWRLGAAAAAVAAVAVSGWWLASRIDSGIPNADPGRDARLSVPAGTATPPAPPDSNPAGGVQSTTPRAAAASPGSTRTARSTRLPARAGAEDVGFVALPAAQGLPPFESGVIVRMEMPPAALPAYGIEIVQDARAPIEADLLIGQDGQARAIRLVTRTSRADARP